VSFNPFDAIKEGLTKKVVAGYVRDAAKLAGFWLASKGIMDGDESSVANFAELAVGVAMFAFAAYKSYMAKKLAEKTVEVALDMAPSTPKPVVTAIAKQELKKN
jgi:hypothetical protein